MKVSLNTVKQYIDFALPPVDELVKRINEQLGGVEEVIDLADKYKDAKIVKVVECEKHPNADRLNVCKIDGGTGELIQVVCGAPNVHADMWAVWLPPESIVPSTYGLAGEFKLGARELRGVMSNGMLAAADELAVGTDHEGILEINPDEWKPSDIEIKPGVSFAEVYGLNDTIIGIENKMFTHRPDLFGQLGVAREISAILGGVTAAEEGFVDTRFENPDWYWLIPEFASGEGLTLETYNDAPENVPRIMFVAMKNIEIKPSPLWLQCALVAMGSKPINNIVDVTNYVMLLTAQPTHAYDYDKLRGKKIGARMAKNGETVKLLNDKTYELTEDDIVIADGEGPIGLGGIMGGGSSEVDEHTKNIVLEVATFDMYAVRKTSMRHGVFTDALTRFNKGQSPLQNNHIMNLLMMSVKDVSSAEQASDVFDLPEKKWQREVSLSGEIEVSVGFINDRLGIDLTVDQIGNLLRRVNFASYPLETDENTLRITAPFWRTDIELPEDIVEEVGRLYGFDKLPRELPVRSMKPSAKNELRELKQAIRENLSRAGANEVLTYSFVHENLMKKVGQNPEHAFRLSNALSPDLQYYRLSLTPSLLDKVNMNVRAGYDRFALFELGKAHVKGSDDAEGLPREFSRLAVVMTDAKNSIEAAPYFMARKYVKELLGSLGITPEFMPVDQTPTEVSDQEALAPFEPGRSAFVHVGDEVFGIVGELKQSVSRAFKLAPATAGCEIDIDNLAELVPQNRTTYRALSKFPSVTQDISLKVTADTTYDELYKVVRESLEEGALTIDISPVTIYQPADDASTKTVTFRVKVTSLEKTLREDEVTALVDKVAVVAKQSLKAERV